MGVKGELPVALRQSEDFKALTEREVDGLRSRLRFIEDSLDEMELWLSGAETHGGDLRNLLDDIELDLSISQSVPEQGRGVSNWLIHTSWTFECGTSCLSAELGHDLRRGLDGNPPGIGSGDEQLELWLRDECSLLREALEGFYAATSARGAVAHLIAINTLVSTLLLGFCRARL